MEPGVLTDSSTVERTPELPRQSKRIPVVILKAVHALDGFESWVAV